MIANILDRRVILIAPVLVGFGAAAYFALPSLAWDLNEWVVLASASGFFLVLLALGVYFARDGRGFNSVHRSSLLGAIFAFGFLWSGVMTQWHVHLQATLPLEDAFRTHDLETEIVWLEKRPLTTMLRVRVVDADERTSYLRLYTRLAKVEALRPGCRAHMRVRVRTISGSVTYGGYDLRLSRFFDDEIGQGFIWRISDITCPPLDRLPGDFKAHVARARLDITDFFKAHMPAPASAVAAALIVGVRGGIPTETVNLFRDSGLAHMLAISGLHMVLFAGALYALLRLLFAFVPPLIERYDVRKICAAVALVSASVYLVMSGANIATQRAFIMITLVFIAIMVDRPALTRHNVAIAALIVLLIRPVSVLSASFQMSFAAVLALVSFYQFIRRYDLVARLRSSGYGWQSRLWRTICLYFASLVMTSLVAGVVTGLIALYHFNRFGNFGLIANLLAIPILGFMIMPSGLAALLLYPFGLAAVPLWVMAAGIDAVLRLSYALVSSRYAVLHIPDSPSWVLVAIFAGLLLVCLAPRWWRLFGVVSLVAAGVGLGRVSIPDVYILGDARVVAMRDARGKLAVSSARSNYVTNMWRRSAGMAGDDWLKLDCTGGLCGIDNGAHEDTNDDAVRTIFVRDAVAWVDLMTACSEADVLIVPHHELKKRRGYTDLGACFVPDLDGVEVEEVVALFYTRDSDGRLVVHDVRVSAGSARLWNRRVGQRLEKKLITP